MIEFICYSLIWIFALYGFIEILKVFIYSFIKIPKGNKDGIHIIIATKDVEEYIETFVRTLFFKTSGYKENESLEVVVVDMNSTDNTVKILKKLQKDYNFELKNLEDIKG